MMLVSDVGNTCATTNDGSGSTLSVIYSIILGDDAAASKAISLLIVSTITLMVIAFHFVNKDWHIVRDFRLTLEGFIDRVPNLATAVEVPSLVVIADAEEEEGGAKTTAGPAPASLALIDPADPTTVRCFSPATLEQLGTVPNLSAHQVSELALRAKTAQRSWSLTTYPQRRRVLRTLQRYIVSNVDEICQLCIQDSGKTQVDALLGEILTTCEKIRTLLHHGETWLVNDYRPVNPMMLHKTAYVQYVPLGVLGIIAPWNYPFHNMLNHVLSGIFSGNGVLTKCSEHTSYSSVYFHNICRAALEINGHDPELLQLCTGVAETGRALVECPHVDKIFFTGSPDVGRRVMAGCAPNLKPVVLELGGKDAMVFVDDAKLDTVIPWAMRGCFQNSGQNCCGVERLFVYESIVTDFIAAIVEKVSTLRQDDPLSSNLVDCGAMVMDAQCTLIQSLVDDAVTKGATVHCGGKRNLSKGGQFYEPTLLSGVTSNMRIWKEEVFGPIMCVVTVQGDNDETCVQLVNDCPFGLGSSVYSANPARALAIGSQFNTGMFTANDFGVNYLIQSLPFGGVKESGFGRFAGPEGLRACCLERSIVVDRIPGVRTSIPGAIDYPMNTKQGMGFGKGLVKLFYGDSLWMKLKGIVDLIKHG
jgi:acyl-CoA reductase-like NAD-dependent aldehyde dehydrogenase